VSAPPSAPLSATVTFTVRADETAATVGSGSLQVLGTPSLLAHCEAATCAALDPGLEPGETSVGTRVELEHVRASPVGATLEVSATEVHRDGRLHRFSVLAREAGGRTVATGEITRVVVDSARFLARL
jgi:fluoroacetyl-CoA thioesterase